MNCEQASEHSAVYADGEADASLQTALAAHLSACPRCRAEVERWQALRRCAQRAMTSEVLPTGLQTRLVARLRRRPALLGQRALRLFGTMSAAAAIILAVTFWPRTAGAKTVVADKFAEIYQMCAVDHRHDGQHVRGLSLAEARAKLAQCLRSRVLVPDLSAHGYKLDGACRCFHVDNVRVVHAYYRAVDDASRVVSVFSVDCCLSLARCENCERGVCHGKCPRQRLYQEAAAQDVLVLKWNDGAATYALCGALARDELYSLADSVDPVLAAVSAAAPSLALLP